MNWIYFTVRVGCTLYLLSRLWDALFRQRLFGLWVWMFGMRQGMEVADSSPLDEVAEESVLGRTHFVYLEDTTKTEVVPERSEELPRADSIQEEPDIDANEVENTLATDGVVLPPSEEELYDEEHQTVPLDAEFSRGMTFNEIAHAVDVLSAASHDDTKRLSAASTIFNLKNTDLFEFFTTQVSNTATVEELLADCLDNNRSPLQNRKSSSDAILDFQWRHYISIR